MNSVIKVIQKINRRARFLILSLPAMIRALLLEPRRHPWRLILDLFILPFNKQFRRSVNYADKYCRIKEVAEDPLKIMVDFGVVKFAIEKSLFDKRVKLIGLLSLYFELLYPYLVKAPIPVLTGGGLYEKVPVLLKESDVVIDVGANVGMFTFWAARKIGPTGRVFAFEPLPEIAKIISDSLKYNAYIGNNIEVVPYALGAASGKLNLNFLPDSLAGKGGDAREIPGSNSNEVVQVTLDDFVKKRGLKKIDFIKMDIEGMEREAVKGALKTITKFKPRLAICIYHLPDDLEVISSFIKKVRPDYQIIKSQYKLYAW